MLYQRCARWSCLLAVVATGWGGVSLGGEPDSPDVRKVNFHIAQQPVGDALTAFGEQSGLAIGIPAALGRDVISQSIDGTFTPVEALTRILASTGLRAEIVDGKTLAIQSATKPTPQAEQSIPEQATLRNFRLADDDQKSGVSTGRRTQGDKSQSPDRGSGSPPEVVITGSRLPIPAGDDTPPARIFSRREIDSIGASNVGELLNYLPQQSFSTDAGNSFAGAQGARLRGLGYGTTLVLINGRRTVTSALLGGGYNYFDLNTIPLSAVERVEVLSESASAIYGADAVGGVVNVILKKKIDRPSIDLYYGTADGGARERRASASAGISLDRFRATAIVDGFDRGFLLGSERSLLASQNYIPYGGPDSRSTVASPGNVTSLSGNLPGLSKSFAAVPIGSTGVGLTPSDFVSTAGKRNLSNLGKFISAVPEARRISALGSAEFDFTDAITGFGEMLYANNHNDSLSIPPFLAAVVPASNPFNPFHTSVLVTKLFPTLPTGEADTHSESYREVAGIRGRFGKWDWEVSLLGTQDSGTYTILHSFNSQALNAALASTNPSSAINPFQDGPGASSALIDSLLAAPTVNDSSSKAWQEAAFVRGSLLDLPSGGVEAVLGAETRKEDLHFESKPAIVISADRRASAAYSEVRVPLVTSNPDRVLLQQLSLKLAGRYDHYSDFGGTFNPEYEMNWKPFSRIVVKVDYSTSFLPPTLYQLYSPVAMQSVAIADPARQNQVTPYTRTSGGNSSLSPTTANTRTAGFSVNPLGNDLFVVDARYWLINEGNRVQALSDNLILANERLFPSRVVRAAQTPADAAAGQPGRLVAINSTYTNFGKLTTDGVDGRVWGRFSSSFGLFTPSIEATWVHRYDSADVPGAPVVNRRGIANSAGTIPSWRLTGIVMWEKHGVGLTSAARYVSAYRDTTLSNVLNGLTVPSQTLVDLQASINFSDLMASAPVWLANTRLRVGATNLFNSGPHYSGVGSFGYDPSEADIRGRFGYMYLSKQF